MPIDDGDRDENRNDCQALFAQPALASACGQREWSVVAGDHGAVDRNQLTRPHDHNLAGADLIDGELDLGAVSPPARWWRKRRICRLFDEGRAAASDSTGGYQCSGRTGGHDIPSPGRHCRPPAAARCVNRARLGPARVPLVREVCPVIHPFPGCSRHAAAQHPSHARCLGVIDTQMLGLGSYVLHSIANVFIFDLRTGLR
jgi:hypothetical protein